MTKHYESLIKLFVASEGYGAFYDPDFGYDLEVMAEDEEVDFKILQQIELDTAARLSQSYNILLSVPEEVLFNFEFRDWIKNAADRFYDHVAFNEKVKKDLKDFK